MAKQKLILLLIIIFCISAMVLGCKGVDMSSPRSTVQSYIDALEKYDHKTVGHCMGVEGARGPKGPDLEFRNVSMGVISQTDTEAVVHAFWEVWVEVKDMKLPAEDMHFEFELIKSGDEWVINEVNVISPTPD